MTTFTSTSTVAPIPLTSFSKMKLGKNPPAHDSRTLRLADYLSPELHFVAPVSVNWANKLTQIGMMANDSIGDCTCAAAAHLVQIWSSNNGSELTIPDADVIKAYEDVGGYRPGDAHTDNGCVELNVLKYWRAIGIGGNRIFAFVALEPRNKEHVKLAIDLLGGCTIGLSLPLSAQSQNLWSVVGGPSAAPGSWGGHEVAVVAYDALGLTCITWGKLLRMSWGFYQKYTDEAYGVLSSAWATGTKQAPSGFTFAQLQSDLRAVTG